MTYQNIRTLYNLPKQISFKLKLKIQRQLFNSQLNFIKVIKPKSITLQTPNLREFLKTDYIRKKRTQSKSCNRLQSIQKQLFTPKQRIHSIKNATFRQLYKKKQEMKSKKKNSFRQAFNQLLKINHAIEQYDLVQQNSQMYSKKMFRNSRFIRNSQLKKQNKIINEKKPFQRWMAQCQHENESKEQQLNLYKHQN